MEQEKMIEKNKRKWIQHWQVINLYVLVYDAAIAVGAYFFALWFRFDGSFSEIDPQYWHAYTKFIPIYAVIVILVNWAAKLYRSVWRYASYDELMRVVIALVINTVLHAIGITLLYERMPISYFIMGSLIQFAFTIGIRFAYRFVLLLRGRNNKESETTSNVMIIGAGTAGQEMIRSIKLSKEINEKVCCYIDDNPNKVGRYIDGCQVYGDRSTIAEAVEKFDIKKIYLCIPSASEKSKSEILNICKEVGCELRVLPAMYQFATGEITVSKMRDVAIEDLLGREPITVNMDEIYNSIEGKTILVTGGGGSIGSELARQIAAHNPKRLVIFDIYENSTYDVQQELKKKYPYLNLSVIIGSVRDSRKIFQVFETYRPQIVYHAAAHKHVPLMEDSPCESIKNNVFGTYKTAYAAMIHGCEKFVLISTDKAVNPTNIMGASKRICEMIVQGFDNKVKTGDAESIPQLFTHHEMKDWSNKPEIKEALKNTKTEFVAVRFGNVLGSNGSVVPLFKKQIEAGGPVTVTHPDIIRYFMTIPEAVRLVMQAGVYAHGGEIFVLDMGEPVKIDDLARNLIKLSGYRPNVDIMIEYTGLRPGEKLYEEKLMAEEGMKKTDNELIHIGSPIPFDLDKFMEQLEKLMESAYKNKSDIGEYVQEIVGTYKPS